MKKLVGIIGGLGALMLGACATSTTGQIAELQGGYIAAASAEYTYDGLPTASPTVKAQLETYRVVAYDDIEPIVLAEENGSSIETALITDAVSALTTYENFETTNGVVKGN